MIPYGRKENYEKNKKNYTSFILTVIAVAMIGILFKGEIIKPAHALTQLTFSTTVKANYAILKTNQAALKDIAYKLKYMERNILKGCGN